MAFTDSEISRLEEIMLRTQERAARNVLQDDKLIEHFWGVGLDAMHDMARKKTGGAVIGAITGLLGKLWLFAVLASLAFALGGWAALPKLWAFINVTKVPGP